VLDSLTSVFQLSIPVLILNDIEGNMRFALWSTDEKTGFVIRSKLEHEKYQTITAQWTAHPELSTQIIVCGNFRSLYHGSLSCDDKRNGWGCSYTSCYLMRYYHWMEEDNSIFDVPFNGIYTGHFLDDKMHGQGSLVSDWCGSNLTAEYGWRVKSVERGHCAMQMVTTTLVSLRRIYLTVEGL
jgi:hypothetical protein